MRGEGRTTCRDDEACARRQVLNEQGRPSTSACNCVEWPCPCVCHGQPRYDADTGAKLPYTPPKVTRIDADDPRARALRAEVDRQKK